MTTIIDGSAGITYPNSTVQASAGVVLQVVNATYATETSNATSTWTDTGLTATITPKFSTSKVLVLVNIPTAKQSSDTYAGLRLLNGSTVLENFVIEGMYTASSATNSGSIGTNYLDSPASTSATTYKVQFSSQSNTSRVYICGTGGRATITLLEIAG
jgi:hypothetical protein